MTYIILCEFCWEPFCGNCNPACTHAPYCPECATDPTNGCRECADDAAGQRDNDYLRGK